MKKFLLICFIIFMITGCGYLEPSEVDKTYVKNAFEKELKKLYGSASFVINIVEFDEAFEDKRAKAIAYPQKKSFIDF